MEGGIPGTIEPMNDNLGDPMPPLHVMIKPVSGACNLHCRYCFYADEMHHRGQAVYPPMTQKTLEAVVRRTLIHADGAVTFMFQGGEPTLAGLPFYEALIAFVQRYNGRHLPVQYALQTNGYALSDEMIVFFARHGFLLGVSLDGIAPVHDAQRIAAAGEPTYERVRGTLDRLQTAGVPFNVLCVVNEQAAAHAREIYEALAPYRYIQFIPCLDALDGQTHQLSEEAYLSFLQTVFDLYERDWRRGHPVSIRSLDNWLQMLLGMPPESCAMNGTCSLQYVVESDGSVYPCDFYALDEWRLGNLNETSLLRISRTDTAKRFIGASLAVPEACRACRWYRLCRNGCRRERDPDTGLNRWCGVMQRFWTRNAERAAQMALDIRRESRRTSGR